MALQELGAALSFYKQRRCEGQIQAVADLLTYGPGIPRYLALWLPLVPVLALLLRRAGAPWSLVAVILSSTLPTFLLHNPPESVSPPWRVGLCAASLLVVGGWLVISLCRTSQVTKTGSTPLVPGHRALSGRQWGAVMLVALGALAVRVPLAWLDPGIGDFATASEHAVRRLLEGVNPYTVENPFTTIGRYQYPAGTILWNIPLVATLPAELLGEAHFGARATLWATDVLAVVLLAWGGARVGRARAGITAAAVYALHPTLVRESALVVANDVVLGVLIAAVAIALALNQPFVAAALTGFAISVKPSALVLIPVLLLVGGPAATVIAFALPGILQFPFLLWPTLGLHGLQAIAEPAARLDTDESLRQTAWLPLYVLAPPSASLLRALSLVNIALALFSAWWAASRLHGILRTWSDVDPSRIAAALALPMLVAFLLGTRWPTNFQSWYLVPFLWSIALVAVPESPHGERTTTGSSRRSGQVEAGA